MCQCCFVAKFGIHFSTKAEHLGPSSEQACQSVHSVGTLQMDVWSAGVLHDSAAGDSSHAFSWKLPQEGNCHCCFGYSLPEPHVTEEHDW